MLRPAFALFVAVVPATAQVSPPQPTAELTLEARAERQPHATLRGRVELRLAGVTEPMQAAVVVFVLRDGGDDGGATRYQPQLKSLALDATLEIDPDTLGLAPALTEVTVEPSFIVPGKSAWKVSARVAAPLKHVVTDVVGVYQGLVDRHISAQILRDNGQSGDATPGDGVFTYHGVYAANQAEDGPRRLRVATEVRAADGSRHATIVEVGGLGVGST